VPPVEDATSASVAPFTLSDQPTAEDKLGFRPYVQAIADFLMNRGTQPPLTLSVEGRWGSGKSSFMKQLQLEVTKKGAKTVWFNAWRYDKEESMLAAFAVALTSDLGKQNNFLPRLNAYAKLQASRFGLRALALVVLARLLAVFVVVFAVYCLFRFGHIDFGKVFEKDALGTIALGLGLPGTILLGIATLRKIYKMTGNPLRIDLKTFANNPRYEERIPTIDKLHEDFERIVRCYADGKKLFVFIDDLDRCDVPKSAEMMQALNLLLSDSLEVIYVIGLDRQKVAAGLAAKFKDLTPFLLHSSALRPGANDKGDALEFGFDYLEKFIQLPYHLPEPSPQGIDKFLLALNGKDVGTDSDQRPREYQLLVVELKSDGEIVSRAAAMVAPVFDNNPRRIKQFINMFRLRALLAGRTGLLSKNPGRAQMTLEQLAKLVAIELGWPALLQDAERDPRLLPALQGIVWKAMGDNTDKTSAWQKHAQTPLEKYWAAKPELMNLIDARMVRPGPPEPLRKLPYALDDIDLGYFLRVSPIVQTHPQKRDLGRSPSDDLQGIVDSVSHGEHSDFSDSASSEGIKAEEVLGVDPQGRTAGPGGANPPQYKGWRGPSSAA